MSEGAMVRISAVICTLNRAAYLAKAVESLINQTYPKEYYEIIVVDNGSTDNTREVVEQFSQFARIRYIYEPIKGLCQARNTGWRAAGGKYVAYLDDDAIACPHWLEKMMKAFETVKPAPASVGGRVVPIWESERPAWLEEQMLGVYAIVNWGDHARFFKLSSSEHHVGCNVAYSLKVLEECGGFNINLGRKGKNLLSNDEHLIRKYMDSHGLGIYYDPEILVDHLVPKERVTRRFMLRRHFWQGISDVVEWYEESPSPPGRLWCLISGLEGLASSGLYLTWFLLQFFLRRPWVVLRDLAKIEPARDCFFRGFDNLWRLVGQSRGYLQISMSPPAKGTRKGIALEQGINSPSHPPPKSWAWRTVRPYLLAYLKTNHPLMISIVRFAKRVMRKLKNILSGSNGMMCNTIMKLTLMTTLLAVLTPARSPRRINPKRRNDTILIIGNGSSTRYLAHLGFDKIPKDVDTFGMGAAYRYYSHIGWWPTYYALCDVKVVFYHQKDLKAIVEDPDIPVRKYFLPLRVSDNEKLEIIPHSSTGDFCVRKAIELGYKRIFIIGIETDYIEQIKESRVLTPEEIEQIGLGQLEEFKNMPASGRHILMVTKTPLVNTNYFFDSYQREGDIYSLPQGDTHYRSWQRLAKLAETSKVKIINLSPTSPLMVFPKASLSNFLNANTYHAFVGPKPPNTADNSSRKTADEPSRVPLPAAKNTASATGTLLYQRFIGYLKRNYPAVITIGRLAKWGLTTLKKTFFGIGGIALLVIITLYVAGILIEPVRWYLVGIASALLLLCGGLLALFYARFILNRFASDQRRQVSDIRKALRTSEATLAGLKEEMAKMNVGNFALFQQYNRRLTKQDLKHFAEEWAPKLGRRLDSRELAYIAHRICLAEDTCVGRLAGNIENMLLRILVARSVKEPNLELLEIGTLFGIGVAIIHESCRGFFNNMHMTVIDPLNGFYDTGQMDMMTKMPVTREIFIHNMQRMNIPKVDYTIIEKLSTEDEAIEQASKKRYNMLIIDADHSYTGTKHDFYNYRHLVKRGGYIVFDDYNNPRWPEVKDFVGKEVVGLPELEFVGTDFYTAVFKVITTKIR